MSEKLYTQQEVDSMVQQAVDKEKTIGNQQMITMVNEAFRICTDATKRILAEVNKNSLTYFENRLKESLIKTKIQTYQEALEKTFFNLEMINFGDTDLNFNQGSVNTIEVIQTRFKASIAELEIELKAFLPE